MTGAKGNSKKLALRGANGRITNSLLFGGLIVLFVLFSLTTNGNFIKMSNLKALLLQSSLYIIAACGVLFVMSNGNLELSVGGIIGMSAAAGCIMSRLTNPAMSLVACLATGILLASVIGGCHILLDVPAFIVGIALMFASGGIVSYLLNIFPKLAHKGLESLNSFWFIIGVTALTYIGFGFILKYTKIGKYNKAIGSNINAAHFCGVNVKKYKYLAYLMYGLCCGMCAFLITVRTGSFSVDTGSGYETEVLIMLIIGGMPMSGGTSSKVRTPLLGALIYMILKNGMTLWGVGADVINIIRVILFFIIVTITYDRSGMRFIP